MLEAREDGSYMPCHTVSCCLDLFLHGVIVDLGVVFPLDNLRIIRVPFCKVALQLLVPLYIQGMFSHTHQH